MGLKNHEDILDYLEQCRDNSGMTTMEMIDSMAKFIAEHDLTNNFIIYMENKDS